MSIDKDKNITMRLRLMQRLCTVQMCINKCKDTKPVPKISISASEVDPDTEQQPGVAYGPARDDMRVFVLLDINRSAP